MAALNEWDCVKYPSEAIRVNIDETRILLENAIAAGVRKFIYFSTAHIYGSPLKGRISEDTLPVPVHPYAITHKAAEDYVVAATLQKKIQGIVIRLSNSFGAPVIPSVNRWTLLANDLARQAIEKGKLVLLSNGCQYRDFVCLTDVENIAGEMATQDNNGNGIIYNLGAGVSMKVIDMANLVAAVYHQLTGRSIAVELPAGAEATNEPGLIYSNERLINKGFIVDNDFAGEMKVLLIFCSRHFKQA
jgi:UDP-glucose 4-epimerase